MYVRVIQTELELYNFLSIYMCIVLTSKCAFLINETQINLDAANEKFRVRGKYRADIFRIDEAPDFQVLIVRDCDRIMAVCHRD